MGNSCIVRIKLNDNTIFMSDEVTSIFYDHDKGEEIVTLCLNGRSISFNLNSIEVLQLYPKNSKVDK